MSINIDGLSTAKLNDNDFLCFIDRYDIISIQETFMLTNDIPSNIFSSFMSPFFSPATKLDEMGRCSGGVIVLVKKTLINYVSVIQHELPNCVILKFSDISHKDLLCIFPYVPCESSPFYNNLLVKNGVTMLESCIHELYTKNPNCSFMIMGDLNGRLSNTQPINECNIANKYTDNINSVSFFMDDTPVYCRKSEDIITSTFGRSLIEMCITFEFIILNGCCKGDNNGSFTYIAPNGNSVIDYCIVSEDLLLNDLYMHVHSRVESKHMPISLTMKISRNINLCHDHVYSFKKFVWNENHLNQFNHEWLDHGIRQNIKDLEQIMYNDIDLTSDCVTAFSELLIHCSHMMFKTVTFDPSKSTSCTTWFDSECYIKKRVVRKYLRKYRNTRSIDNKALYVGHRREYKALLKFKKRRYFENKCNHIMNSLDNPISFWKEIRSVCQKSQVTCDIDLPQWYRYFKKLFQLPSTLPPICAEPKPTAVVSAASLTSLNSPITAIEVNTAVSRSKARKALGPDNISNELVKHTLTDSFDFILHALNNIFKTHTFPVEWTTSNIIPIHKKGDKNVCDNYRSIWLTSLFSKIYTAILDKRLGCFTTRNKTLPEEQAGFREGYSTIDHIFSLYAMIKKQFTKDRKLYVCFVDYRKAFDSVNREALFNILERNGISGDYLLAIKSIYKSVLASVKKDGNLSDYFECPSGLKQGCLLSPKLFTIFMTEISKKLNQDGIHGIQFLSNYPLIFHLLFADDLALVSDTVGGLQKQLNILREQSLRLGLEINLTKTQVVVFRKGGYLAKIEKWYYGEHKLQVVNCYTYLGLNFTTRLSFNNATSPFIAKAKQSCFQINRSLNSINCYNLNVFAKLFDSKVYPVLSYACELWGMNDMPEIEKVHTVCMKRFLNVSIHCSNVTLYADTGRYPLSINHKLRCVKYWLRLLKLDKARIAKQAYEMLLSLYESKQCSDSWVADIRTLLLENGFGLVWLNKQVGNEKRFLQSLKTRLVDCFKQGWNAKMSVSDNFQCFYSFKSQIAPELFLNDQTFSRLHRNVLIQFRLGVSKINGHRYKFYKNKALLKCPSCKNVNEDEFHILFCCPVYEELRLKMLPQNIICQRNVYSMCKLMSETVYHRCVARYLVNVFIKRSELLERANV